MRASEVAIITLICFVVSFAISISDTLYKYHRYGITGAPCVYIEQTKKFIGMSTEPCGDVYSYPLPELKWYNMGFYSLAGFILYITNSVFVTFFIIFPILFLMIPVGIMLIIWKLFHNPELLLLALPLFFQPSFIIEIAAHFTRLLVLLFLTYGLYLLLVAIQKKNHWMVAIATVLLLCMFFMHRTPIKDELFLYPKYFLMFLPIPMAYLFQKLWNRKPKLASLLLYSIVISFSAFFLSTCIFEKVLLKVIVWEIGGWPI